MDATTSGTTFFSLPTELRLQIAACILHQSDNVGILQPNKESRIDPTFDPASNLSILLVCREFHRDFANIAYQMTRFFFIGPQMLVPLRAPDRKLQNLRKVVVNAHWPYIDDWHMYPFNKECIALQELSVILLPYNDHVISSATSLLHRLQNVQKIRIFPSVGNYQLTYGQLVGAMYKDDHYHRYDVQGAPIVQKTWWEPRFNSCDTSFDFEICEAEPVMAEEDYMVMMKPKIDEIMEWMSKWSIL
jgi:hypothetical protein